VGLLYQTSSDISQHLGIHYYPDTLHYRNVDLETWLPVLGYMGVRWLTLLAPRERAIPEQFIRGLIVRGIQPILHFQLSTRSPSSPESFRSLFRSYARWGVNWISLFDRPNLRSSWSEADWAQADLVERFIDLFQPLAEIAVEEGLSPIFPPLEPGGDYWDLSFLQTSLQALQRRGRTRLLEKLALGAYAWINQKPLEWGAGGPERWPASRPYFTPEGSEDHLGFRIFDWYLAVSESVLGRGLPMFLLRAGSLPEDHLNSQTTTPDLDRHAELILSAADLFLSGTERKGEMPFPTEIKACCFWLLAAHERSPHAGQAWIKEDGEKLPVVNVFFRLGARRHLVGFEDPGSLREETAEGGSISSESVDAKPVELESLPLVHDFEQESEAEAVEVTPTVSLAPIAPDNNLDGQSSTDKDAGLPITHYVLLPLYAWGAAEWDLTAIQPLLQDTHPTVGFSLAEARLAARVTVVGGEGAVSAEALDMLRANGCRVERVLDNGMLVAS
jgi:hypothetical protein